MWESWGSKITKNKSTEEIIIHKLTIRYLLAEKLTEIARLYTLLNHLLATLITLLSWWVVFMGLVVNSRIKSPNFKNPSALDWIWRQGSWIQLSKLCSERGNKVIVYECTSHSSNVKTWPPTCLLLVHLKWLRVDWFGFSKVNSSTKSTRETNLRATYYFMVFTLAEREVHLYTRIPSLRNTPRVTW